MFFPYSIQKLFAFLIIGEIDEWNIDFILILFKRDMDPPWKLKTKYGIGFRFRIYKSFSWLFNFHLMIIVFGHACNELTINLERNASLLWSDIDWGNIYCDSSTFIYIFFLLYFKFGISYLYVADLRTTQRSSMLFYLIHY